MLKHISCTGCKRALTSIKPKQVTYLNPIITLTLSTEINRWSSSSPKRTSLSNQSNQIHENKPLSNVRKQLWEFYFSTGRGASALFETIDLHEKGYILPSEIKTFMKEVLSYKDSKSNKTVLVYLDPRDLMPYAWNILEKRERQGEKYDMKHFKKWLVAATKLSADTKNSRIMQQYLAN